MKAVVYDRYGSADQPRVEEVERPTAGPGEVLVRVVASSVNSWDWHLLTGGSMSRIVQFGLVLPLATRFGRRRCTIRTHTFSSDDLAWLANRVIAGDAARQ